MARFREDYLLVKETDEKGRTRSVMKYIGSDYFFIENDSEVKAFAKKFAAAMLLGWICYAAPLCVMNGSQTFIFTAMPFIFLAFPLYVLSKCAIIMLFKKRPIEHRDAVTLDTYAKVASYCQILFCAVCAGGFVIGYITKKLQFGPGEYLHIACDVLLCLIGIFVYRSLKYFKTREVINLKPYR